VSLPTPHAPRLEYLCYDYDCCENRCPRVTCRSCDEKWPCTDWRSRHTATQVEAQLRYVARKHYPGDPDMVEYAVRQGVTP
jgi:hypothetical protein